MTVDFIYELVLFICNKNQRGSITPAAFNRTINVAQYGFVAFLLGEYQKYANGRPVPAVALGMNRRVRQSLSVITEHGVPLAINGAGFSTYPTDHEYTDAMFTTSDKEIRYVEQHNLHWALASEVDPIATNPIYTLEKTGFRFYPNSLGAAKVSFVKTPPTINYGTTPDLNGRQVYEAATSVHPVWGEVDCFEIIVRALRPIGVHLQHQDVSQYANEVKNGGQ